VIRGCLATRATSPNVVLRELPTNEVLSQDDYKSGYAAPFYFKAERQDIGYAVRGNGAALIFSSRLYPLASAKAVLGTTMAPSTFNPNLSDWSTVGESRGRYLCVSFNLDGLGRSGSFQNVRGGYLLSITGTRKLYFAVTNIEQIR
jgi:hypothetical protein